MYSLSSGNEFYLHAHCLANKIYFHWKGYVPGVVLKQTKVMTQKLPVKCFIFLFITSWKL